MSNLNNVTNKVPTNDAIIKNDDFLNLLSSKTLLNSSLYTKNNQVAELSSYTPNLFDQIRAGKDGFHEGFRPALVKLADDTEETVGNVIKGGIKISENTKNFVTIKEFRQEAFNDGKKLGVDSYNGAKNYILETKEDPKKPIVDIFILAKKLENNIEKTFDSLVKSTNIKANEWAEQYSKEPSKVRFISKTIGGGLPEAVVAFIPVVGGIKAGNAINIKTDGSDSSFDGKKPHLKDALKSAKKREYANKVGAGFESLEVAQNEIKKAISIIEPLGFDDLHNKLKNYRNELTIPKITLRVLKGDIEDGSAYSFLETVGNAKQKMALQPYKISTNAIFSLSEDLNIESSRMSELVGILNQSSQKLVNPRKFDNGFDTEDMLKSKAKKEIEKTTKKIEETIIEMDNLSKKMLAEEGKIRQAKENANKMKEHGPRSNPVKKKISSNVGIAFDNLETVQKKIKNIADNIESLGLTDASAKLKKFRNELTKPKVIIKILKEDIETDSIFKFSKNISYQNKKTVQRLYEAPVNNISILSENMNVKLVKIIEVENRIKELFEYIANPKKFNKSLESDYTFKITQKYKIEDISKKFDKILEDMSLISSQMIDEESKIRKIK